MKKAKKLSFKVAYEQKTVDALYVQVDGGEISEEKVAMYALSDPPEIRLNRVEQGYKLLSDPVEFRSAKEAGHTSFSAKVYRFSEEEAKLFTLLFRIRAGLPVMEESYAMQMLVDEYGLTQEKIASLTGKSRPAIANTLRLLRLEGEVIGLIESGKLSAGHARALIKVPKEKQYAFAVETIEKGVSVRETERAVKAFLTPPEVLQKQKEEQAKARGELLKSIVEKGRSALGLNVSLIGTDKKGRIYIDYHSQDELYRFEEALSVVENFRK